MKEHVCDAVDVPMGTYEPRAGERVNAALTEICSMLRLQQSLVSFTVTPGLGDYSIATSFGTTSASMIRDLYYLPVGQQQPGSPMQRTSVSRIDEIRGRSISNSYPQQYAISGVGIILLGPAPSDAGTLSCRVVVTGDQLAADSDSPLTVPVEYHDVVWLGAAVAMCFAQRTMIAPPRVQLLQQRYDRRLADLRSWIVDIGGEQPMRMQRAGVVVPNRDPSIYPQTASY